jgi:hypothetical protein
MLEERVLQLVTTIEYHMHLTALLILISAFSVQGSATETTAFQLISEGPAQSAPDLLVHAQFLFTINANVKSL